MRIVSNDGLLAVDLDVGQYRQVFVELPKLYLRWNLEFRNNENWSFFEDCKEIAWKYIHVIFDPINLSLNSKILLNKLNVEIEEQAIGTTDFEEIHSLIQRVNDLYLDLSTNCMYDVDYNQDITLEDIIKLANFRFNLEIDEGNFLDMLIKYMDILRDILNVRLFVVFGISSYLDDNEKTLLHEYIKHNELCVMFIDMANVKEGKDIKNIIIDRDLCII